MQKLLIFLSLVIFIAVLACARPQVASNTAAAVAATSEPAAQPQDDAPRITLADAKKAFDGGTAYFIDARPGDSYQAEHIKGAVNITLDTLSKEIKHLPKDKTLIAYCSWPREHTSASLVSEMQKKGVKNVFALLGGTQGWKDAGYPMESDK